MPDREKYIEVLSKTVKTVKEYNEDAPIKISLECIEDILELLKEQEDLGTELTNAVELIHKKNEQIEKLLKEQDNEKKRIMKVIWDTLHEGLSIDTVADQDLVYERIRHRIEDA